MKAEDSVMPPEQYESYRKEADNTARDYANATEGNFKQSDIEAIYKAAEIYALIKQAEISFKAGYNQHKLETCDNCDTPLIKEGELYQKLEAAKRAGTKEVVEWIREHFEDVTGKGSVEQILAIPKYK